MYKTSIDFNMSIIIWRGRNTSICWLFNLDHREVQYILYLYL